MSLETQLFELINKNEYTIALTLLEQVDINALDEDGCSLLMAAIENHINASAERYTFMERVVSHPQFTHANKPVDGTIALPFQAVINQADPRAVDVLIKYKDAKNIQVIFCEEKLLYEQFAQAIQDGKEYIAKNPTSASHDRIVHKEKILASILQATVHHAIKTDDPSLLQRLADAGASLHLPLKDGTSPMDLVQDKEDSRVHKWLSRHIKEYVAKNPVYLLAARNLTRKHEEKAQSIVDDHTAEVRDKIKSMFRFYDYKPEQPSTGKHEPDGGNTPKQ